MKLRNLHTPPSITIFTPQVDSVLELPYVSEGISAGFPSPADDFLDINIDLNKHLIKNPSTTFYGRVKGNSMMDAGIHENNEPKMSLPQFVIDKLKDINPNGKLNGTWDLIVWKNKELKFIELKRQKKDKIRQTQIDFLERALKNGIAVESFEIYEWVENLGS